MKQMTGLMTCGARYFLNVDEELAYQFLMLVVLSIMASMHSAHELFAGLAGKFRGGLSSSWNLANHRSYENTDLMRNCSAS